MGSLFSSPKMPAMPPPLPPPPPPPTPARAPVQASAAGAGNTKSKAAAASMKEDGLGPQGLVEEPKTANVTLLGGTK